MGAVATADLAYKYASRLFKKVPTTTTLTQTTEVQVLKKS